MPKRQTKGVSLAKKFEENFDSDEEEEIEEEHIRFGRRLATGCTHVAYMAKTFAILNGKDIRRRKGTYCLGVFSCLLVVMITALMLTVLTNLPILFLRLGEAESGEADLILSPGGEASLAATLNYSKIASYFPDGSPQSYHTPRTFSDSAEIFNRAKCLGSEKNTPSADIYNTSFLWVPPNGQQYGDTCTSSAGCPNAHCGPGSSLVTVFIDPEREERMGLGTSYTGKKPIDNEIVISTNLAIELGVEVGDHVIWWEKNLPRRLLQAYQDSNLDRYEPFSPVPNSQYTKYPTGIVSLRVIDIVKGNGRKLSDSVSRFVFMNFQNMTQIISGGLSPLVGDEQRAAFADSNPNQMATEVIFNMPPAERIANYAQSDNAQVQAAAIRFASPIIIDVGFNQVSISMPIVEYFFGARFFALFLGLILSMIITGLSALSIILIYSLLIVGVETKTFELAVMRMVGMTRVNLVFYVLTSASAFAIPAWVFGLVLAQLVFLLVRNALSSSLSVDLPPGLSGDAVGFATLAGIGIPLLSSFAPMSSVLAQDLPSALDTNRNRVETIKYEINKAGEAYVDWLLVGFGTALVVFGFLIYYLFPQALLNFNIALLFYIFFGLLLGMLFGFVLLAINFERIIETAVQYLFLFWESDANFILVEKNMTAHRRRNRKTTLMYSMALGFIIFITVAFQIQLTSTEFQTKRQMGGEIAIYVGDGEGKGMDFQQMSVLDEILQRTDIESLLLPEGQGYTWHSGTMINQPTVANATMLTIGRLVTETTMMEALAPNFFDVADKQFLTVGMQDEDNGFSLAEQLYTEEGSGRALIGSKYRSTMALDSMNSRFNVEVRTENINSSGVYRRVASPQALIDIAPVVAFSKFPQFAPQTLGVSATAFLRRSFSLQSFRSMMFQSVIVRCSLANADELQSKLLSAVSLHPDLGPAAGIRVQNYKDEVEALSTARTVVNVFFVFTQVMAMVICFFSLMSSMAANIHEQAKEIGVLRAIGMRISPMKRVYVEEAFCIVVSSSLMGVIVGVGVAYTMFIQQILFTQLPLPFVFPWIQLVVVCVVALFGAFMSSYGPITALLSAPSIPHILRRTT